MLELLIVTLWIGSFTVLIRYHSIASFSIGFRVFLAIFG